MGFAIKWALKTVLGRWVTGILVTSLLSGAAYSWYNFKDNLVQEGQQACIQEINRETMEQLQLALAAEKSARAELIAKLDAAAAVNLKAKERRSLLLDQLNGLEKAMAEQRKNDETYREWSDSDLPDGVADRLRGEATGDNQSPLRDD